MSNIAEFREIGGKRFRIKKSKWYHKFVCECGYIFGDSGSWSVCPECGGSNNTGKSLRDVYKLVLGFIPIKIETEIKSRF